MLAFCCQMKIVGLFFSGIQAGFDLCFLLLVVPLLSGASGVGGAAAARLRRKAAPFEITSGLAATALSFYLLFDKKQDWYLYSGICQVLGLAIGLVMGQITEKSKVGKGLRIARSLKALVDIAAFVTFMVAIVSPAPKLAPVHHHH